MIFRAYFFDYDNDESSPEAFAKKYAHQTFTQKGMLKIYWGNEIKHNKMLHLFFVPDKNSMLILEGKWVESMVQKDDFYESSDNMPREIKDMFNHIDWLYLFGKNITIQISPYESKPDTTIPCDINYKTLLSLGEKYRPFFDRHLGSIIVPVEVTFSNLQISKFFNPSGREFALEYDFPLYFPTATILHIKEIPKNSVGALPYEEAWKDLSKPTLDFLYTESFSPNLDSQILALYLQSEDEFSDISDESIKNHYETMLKSHNNNVFVSLRRSPQIKDDNEIAKLAIQDYNIAGYSFDKTSESATIRANKKLQLQRFFQSKYYQKYKDELGKVVFLNDSLFSYNILVLDILNDEWCKVDILKINTCSNEETECAKFDYTYNQIYMRHPEKLRIYQGYMQCKELNKGLDFES